MYNCICDLTDDELLERAVHITDGLERGKDWFAHAVVLNEESIRRGYGTLVEYKGKAIVWG